jgi:glycosyltransferase 2 family protein
MVATRIRKFQRWGLQLGLASLGIALGLFLGGLAVQGVDWGQVGKALRQFPPGLFLLAFLLVLSAYYLRALRWRLLLVGQPVRTFRLFLVETSAIGLNNLSPVRVVAVPVQIGILTLRDGLNPGTTLATMGVARLFDLIVTVIAIWGIILVVPGLKTFAPLAVVAIATSGFGILLLFLAGFGTRIIARFRHLSFVAGFVTAVVAIRNHPGRAALACALTAVYWAMIGLSGWLLTVGIGHPVPVHLGMVAMLGTLFFATSVPGLPAALGTFEFAVRMLLELMDVPAEPAITVAILAHFLLFFTPMIFTIVVLPREGLASLTNLREVIRVGLTRQEPT